MIYVVRHGETEWNAINKVLGRTDIPLNDRGIEQAEEMARSLKDVKIDVFLCSPLSRARQTADAISDVTGIPYKTDGRLIEHDFGIFEGVNRFDEGIIRSYFEDMGNEEFVQFSQGNCEIRMYP